MALLSLMINREPDLIWVLVARKLAGEATGEELTELEKLLQSDPGLQEKVDTLTRLWAESSAEPEPKPSPKGLWQRIKGITKNILRKN